MGILKLLQSVGEIGIMNIMLVSVTERTREIGVRLAIGGYRRGLSVPSRSVGISILGGFLGVIAGVGASSLFQSTLQWEIKLTPTPGFFGIDCSGYRNLLWVLPITKSVSIEPD